MRRQLAVDCERDYGASVRQAYIAVHPGVPATGTVGTPFLGVDQPTVLPRHPANNHHHPRTPPFTPCRKPLLRATTRRRRICPTRARRPRRRATRPTQRPLRASGPRRTTGRTSGRLTSTSSCSRRRAEAPPVSGAARPAGRAPRLLPSPAPVPRRPASRAAPAQAMEKVTERLALCKRSQDAGKGGQLVIIHGQARQPPSPQQSRGGARRLTAAPRMCRASTPLPRRRRTTATATRPSSPPSRHAPKQQAPCLLPKHHLPPVVKRIMVLTVFALPTTPPTGVPHHEQLQVDSGHRARPAERGLPDC